VDFQHISGWLTSADSPTIRFAQVFVDGNEVGTVKADSFRGDLKEKKVSDGHSGFRFFFSTPPDIFKDHKIEVRDRDTGESIGRKDITLSCYISTMADATSMLEFDRNLRAVHLINVSYESEKCHLTLQIVCPGEITPGVSTDDGRLEGSRLERYPDAFFESLGLHCYIMRVDLVPDASPGNAIIRIMSTSASPAMMDDLSAVAIPKKVPNYSSLLSDENMSRVMGPGLTKGGFAAGGLNTAYRLHLLLQHHFHNGLDSFKNILDWGVGAGRVALPIKHSVAPDSRVVGVDVDDYNVEFGKRNFPEIEFLHSPFLPPLPFEDGAFDLVFGVSVFTHLSEGVQFLWLKELRRIVKRGAPVIVSIHGERVIFHTAQWNLVPLMETSKFGISDSMIDTHLGPKLSDPRYYRATFHARKYIAARWVEYFDLVGHHPCTNGMLQDFVVLRAK
jgi:SAM-dependent methyltransferase